MLTAVAFAALTSAQWSIGPQLQLNFEGQDWLPVGIQTPYRPASIELAARSGIRDFLIESTLAEDWAPIAKGMGDRKYLLSITTAMKPTVGFTSQPQYYRLNDIRRSSQIIAPLPAATEALIVVALKRDASLISHGVFPVKDGVLRAEIRAAEDADQVVLVYPIGESLETEDLWEGLDDRRDRILRQIRTMGKSKGLRGIVNPLGSAPMLTNLDNGFIPSSPLFRREFAEYLESKYATLEGVMRAWGLRAALTDDKASISQAFYSVTRFVPLWNAGRGVPYMFDTQTKELVIADSKRSTYWRDIAQVIGETRGRRVHRLLRSIRAAAEVPVFQEWAGWSWFFENPNSELSGLTVKLNSISPNATLQAVAGALSSNLRTNRPGPVIATDLPANQDSLSPETVAMLTSVGVRGMFFRYTDGLDLKRIAELQFGPKIERPSSIFFPVNAANPAMTAVLGAGTLMLPSPESGNRLDLGRDLNGYIVSEGGSTAYVMWANSPGVYEFRTSETGSLSFRPYGGSAPVPEATKFGYRMELGRAPVLIRGAKTMPVPEAELLRLEREIRQMMEYAVSRRMDIVTENFKFRNFAELVKANPANAFQLAKEVHRSLVQLVTGLTWAEFEASSDNNFSSVQTDAGCSGGSALTLRTPLGALSGVVHATLKLTQRTPDNQELWLAAKIPSLIDRQNLRVKIGGQVYPLPEASVESYGSGYAWYRLGMVRLPSAKTDIRIDLVGSSTTEIGLDCLVLSPQPFRPQSVFLPPMLLPSPPKSNGKPGVKPLP